jgi:spore photoproduct lyase family protein
MQLPLFDLPVSDPAPERPAPLADRPALLADLLDVQQIYLEPDLEARFPRARAILARFPGVERIEVPSHWNIPGLHGNEGSAEQWMQIKRSTLVLGTKKSLSADRNDRSSDFTAPSHASGCALGCAYCYVPRRKGFANPISTFVNIEQIAGYIERHAKRQGLKTTPTTADPDLWVYEIGNTSDCSVDALISDNVHDLIAMARHMPNAKLTFATKYVNRGLLAYDPQKKTRIRFSLMPQTVSRLVDVRTSKIADRIAAINDFDAAGYEVNVNFAPVIHYPGWQADWAALFDQVDAALSPRVKANLFAEIIFLTHNDRLHDVNLMWHPKAEALLWQPDLQETKYSQTGGRNLRYRRTLKSGWVAEMVALMSAHMPYCRVRYAF